MSAGIVNGDACGTRGGRLRDDGFWATAAGSVDARTVLLVAAGVLLLGAVSAVAHGLVRGPWMDEYWSLWYGDPSVPIARAFRERWLFDVHPPLFNLLSHTATSLLGFELEPLRLLNLIPLLAFVGYWGWLAVRMPGERRLLGVYLLIVGSCPFLVKYFAEYRSYFIQLMLGSMLALSCFVAARPAALARSGRTVTLGVLTGSLFLLVNLHYIAAAFALILVGLTALGRLAAGEWRLGVGLAGACAISLAPLLTFLALQHDLISAQAGGNFWIETTTREAVVTLAKVVVLSLGGNVAAGLLALAGLAALAMGRCSSPARVAPGGESVAGGASPGSEPAEREAAGSGPVPGYGFWSDYGRAVLTSIVALALFTAFLLVVNLRTPLVIERYLMVMGGSVALITAALCWRLASGNGLALALVTANALAMIGFRDVRAYDGRKHWDRSAEIVAAHVAACPGTRVLAREFVAKRDAPPRGVEFPHTSESFNFAYEQLARRHGFRVALLPKNGLVPLAGAGACPTLVWIEHMPEEKIERFADPAVFAATNGIGIPAGAAARVELGRSGAVLVLPGSGEASRTRPAAAPSEPLGRS